MSARRVPLTPDAWDDDVDWPGQDRKTLKRINQLIREAQRTSVEGIGRPELLKVDLSGFWSRRIDDTNRLVHEADDFQISIISCRYHYQA